MDAILTTILVRGEDSVTSKDICATASAIARKRLTHLEARRLVDAHFPDVRAVREPGGGGAKFPHFRFEGLTFISPAELAARAEVILFAVTLEEFDALTAHVAWAREAAWDVTTLPPTDVEQAVVLCVKIRRRRMESAYAAAIFALTIAKDCKSLAKITFVGAPFGTGTICLLAPDPQDVVVFDQFEVGAEGILTSKVGLPNRRLLFWSYGLERETQPFRLRRVPLVTGRGRIVGYDELPTPQAMYEWEAHGLLEAREAMDKATTDFTVIGLVTDSLGNPGVRNQPREAAKETFKALLKKLFDEDALFFAP